MVWPKARTSQPGKMRRAPSSQPDVPVGLGAGGGRRRLGGVVGPVQPHGVDLGQAAEGGDHPGDDEEQADGLGCVRRPQVRALDVVLGAARSSELGVLLAPQDGQVGAEEAGDGRRQQEHVEDEEAGDELGVGELATEEQEGQPLPRHRDGQGDRVAHPHTRAREQVVEQGVPEEAVHHRQDEQGHADDPVELPGPAERPGEEHPAHVHDQGGEEDQGGPVVHLAHDQAGPHLEADVQRRGVGGRHPRALQGLVGAVVDDLVGGGDEEERQVDARHHQDDEAVHGDLADHERPVVGEDLVEGLAGEVGGAEALVDPPEQRFRHGSVPVPEPRAHGLVEVPLGHQEALPVD